MAAGLGFKNFNTGEVLTSADVNGYLMQGVLVFASEAARNAAITSPQEGQFAYTKDNNSLWYYTGSVWAASGATGDIEGVTAGTGISGGGTSGTVTITNSMATEIDAKGDLVVGTGADTFSRLAVGTNGQVLTADSSETTGLKFATPAGGGGDFVKITSATFTDQASVTVDSCFTSTYSDYVVYIVAGYATGGSSASDLQVQFRYSSSTQTSDYYGSYFQYNRGNSLGTGGFANVAQNNLAYDLGDSTSPTQAKLNFFKVGNSSENAGYYATGNVIIADQAAFVSTGWVNVARTYTGFLIKASAGNITGNYAVYGVTK